MLVEIRMPTIREVAKACGLSAMTVSAVLNNRLGETSPETRQRVLRVVKEMNYHPNAIARGLSRRRMNTLGIVMSYEGNPSVTSDRYISPILNGILVANKSFHQRTLLIAEDHWEDVQNKLPSYLDGHCDGLIFLLPIMQSEAFLPLQERHLPFVIIGENCSDPAMTCVDMDNVGAAHLAVRFLLDHGHRQIAHFKGSDFLSSAQQREQGYREALARANIPCDERFILPGDYSMASGYERMQYLLTRWNQVHPTAVFCADDAIALGVLQALTEHGMRVPEEVSLIGINDDSGAATANPGLTTVQQPFHELGQQAVELLLSQIKLAAAPKNVDASSRNNVLLPGTVVVRKSVSKPASDCTTS